MRSTMAYFVNGPTRVENIKTNLSCCICLRTGSVVNIADSRRIQEVLANDFPQYIMLESTSFLCTQCCLMLQMCCSIDDWSRAMDLFDAYYRSQYISMAEDYVSPVVDRKRRRMQEVSKFQMVKRRLFEEEEESTESRMESSCSAEAEGSSGVSDDSGSVIVDGEVELPENDGVLPDYYVDYCCGMA